MPDRPEKVGIIGLGDMGSRIASRLLQAGVKVYGYNRTKAKAEWLISKGLLWRDSPEAITRDVDVIITMVTDTKALELVSQEIIRAIGPGKIFIDMSTVSPAFSRNLSEKVRIKGAEMLDAPVSGSILSLERGELAFMVGGSRKAFDQVQSLLKLIGPTVNYLGPNGSGAAMKIAVNLNIASQILAFSESVILAQKYGIAKEIAVRVLTSSAVASPVIKYRGPFVLEQPEKSWFDVNMMQKDLKLALELAEQVKAPLPTTSLTNEFLKIARALGMENEDYACLYNVLAHAAGEINWKPKKKSKL